MDETPQRGRLYQHIKLSNHGTHDRPNVGGCRVLPRRPAFRACRDFLDLCCLPQNPKLMSYAILAVSLTALLMFDPYNGHIK